MKIYGRQDDDASAPLLLTEVSFVASSDELRSIADFLLAQADAMSGSKSFDHRHYLDFIGVDIDQEDIIVVNPDSLR